MSTIGIVEVPFAERRGMSFPHEVSTMNVRQKGGKPPTLLRSGDSPAKQAQPKAPLPHDLRARDILPS
jgi:hypothetical protein